MVLRAKRGGPGLLSLYYILHWVEVQLNTGTEFCQLCCYTKKSTLFPKLLYGITALVCITIKKNSKCKKDPSFSHELGFQLTLLSNLTDLERLPLRPIILLD